MSRKDPLPKTYDPQSPAATLQLRNLVAEKLLRWSQPGALRWVIARERAEDLVLPPRVEVHWRKMKSRAISYRVPRQYRNATVIAKTWPDDHLSALRIAKVLCVTSGEAAIELGDYELNLPSGTFLFIPPGIPQPDGALGHLRDYHRERQCDVWWTSPFGEHIHFWQCHCNDHEHYTPAWSNIFFRDQRLRHYFDFIHQETMREEGLALPIISHLMILLFLEAQRAIESDDFLRLAHWGYSLPRSERMHDPIAMATQYLDMNLESAITIESLARQVGMSRSQLAARFRERTGQTVVGYLTQKRLEQAAKFLRETEWTMTYIAGFVGFHSVAHFHTLFKKHYQVSPAQYRQQNSQKRDDTEHLQTI